MNKLSFNVSLGGIISALCIIMMFCVGIFPVFLYVFPIICGLLISVVYYECGVKTSIASYAAVSLLSLIISPDKESALLFTAFFGYYPIIKIYIDKIKITIARFLIKLVLFNLTVIGSYYILIYIFGVIDLSEFNTGYEKYAIYILIALGNIVMLFYDVATKRLTQKYLLQWRKLFFKDNRR